MPKGQKGIPKPKKVLPALAQKFYDALEAEAKRMQSMVQGIKDKQEKDDASSQGELLQSRRTDSEAD